MWLHSFCHISYSFSWHCNVSIKCRSTSYYNIYSHITVSDIAPCREIVAMTYCVIAGWGGGGGGGIKGEYSLC